MTARKVIINTDFSTDVGDLGAVALACAAHRIGIFDVLGFVIDSSYTYAPGACRATAQYFGLSGQSYGCWKGTPIDETIVSQMWCKSLYDNFPHSGVGLASTVDDSTVAYRTMLAAQPNGSVDIVAIGFLNAVSALLDSPGDGISPLTGAQLIAAKVRKLFVMGGDYAGGPAEWNFKGGATPRSDITNATANICTNWPSPVRFVGFEAGTFTVGGTFGRNTSTDLIANGYSVHGSSSGRTAWDELAMLACLQDCGDFVQVFGSNSINTTTGANTWVLNPAGKDAYLSKITSDARLKTRINFYVGADASASPFFTSWGSEGFLRVEAA